MEWPKPLTHSVCPTLQLAVLTDLCDAEVEGTMILQNVRNFLPRDRDTFQETCVSSNIAL